MTDIFLDTLLRTSLLDLIHMLGATANRILLGGGYGLYLKQLHLAATKQRTLINAELWPSPRATEDLDLLLTTEIVGDVETMQSIRKALDTLGYHVIPGSEYLQFLRTTPNGQFVKVDLLTSQLDTLKQHANIRADPRRARPRDSSKAQLHAHPTDGALSLDDPVTLIPVAGVLSSGGPYQTHLRIPPPFSYLLMKLTAYRDRLDDPNKDFGQHHALDLFRIVAMLTEQEDRMFRHLAKQHATNAVVLECRDLICSDFAKTQSPGVLRLRQHPLWHEDKQALSLFLETLTHLIPSTL